MRSRGFLRRVDTFRGPQAGTAGCWRPKGVKCFLQTRPAVKVTRSPSRKGDSERQDRGLREAFPPFGEPPPGFSFEPTPHRNQAPHTHTHTHARTRARAHARTRARAHTHTKATSSLTPTHTVSLQDLSHRPLHEAVSSHRPPSLFPPPSDNPTRTTKTTRPDICVWRYFMVQRHYLCVCVCVCVFVCVHVCVRARACVCVCVGNRSTTTT